MSKPYFAMLLPSDKKLKEQVDTYHVLAGELKMYLCTKDIKVGDRVWERLATGEWMDWKIDNENDFDLDNQLKVIARISTEAVWVKEQDRFDETELLVMEWGGSSVRKPLKFAQITEDSYIKIKCPLCETFH